MPNSINTTEVDIKKAYRKGGSSLGSGSSGSTRVHNNLSVEQLTRHVSLFFSWDANAFLLLMACVGFFKTDVCAKMSQI